MRVLGILAGSVLWILAGVLGLVGALLCVTLILLPLGIPVLWLARKLFRAAMAMMVPRKARHPVAAAAESISSGADDARKRMSKRMSKNVTKPMSKKVAKPMSKKASKAADQGRSFLKHQRKRFA